MIDKRVSAIKVLYSDRLVDQLVIIVAFNDLSVHMLKFKTSEYLFDSRGDVNQIFGCFEHGKVTVALIQNNFSKENENCYQTLEVRITKFFYTSLNTLLFIYICIYIFVGLVKHSTNKQTFCNDYTKFYELLRVSW